MPITGPASYVPTINEFLAHWQQANAALPSAAPLLVRLALSNSTVTRAQLVLQRDALMAQQLAVQSKLTDWQLARGTILLAKRALLERFNQFTTALEAYWQNTSFILARPYAASLSDGQENFCRPLGEAMLLWAKINAGPAPAGACCR